MRGSGRFPITITACNIFFEKQYSKQYHTNPETQDKKSCINLIGASVQSTDYQLSCDKMAFYSGPFESVEVCLSRFDTQFKGIAALADDEQRNIYKNTNNCK